MPTTPQIIDIILLVIILISAIRCFMDGFATSIVKLVGNIAGFVAAWIVSKRWSPVVFGNLFRENMVEKTYTYIQDKSRMVDVQALLQEFTGTLPENFMQELTAKAEETIAQITTPTREVAEMIVDTLLAPAVTIIIALVIFAIVCTLCNILAGLLAKAFKAINHIPVIGFANRMGGFAVGMVIGVIYIILISCVLSIIVIITENSLTFLNMEVLNQSKILSMTGLVNPFIG